jgi:hypothetical protein
MTYLNLAGAKADGTTHVLANLRGGKAGLSKEPDIGMVCKPSKYDDTYLGE